MIDYAWKCWNTMNIRRNMLRYVNIYRISCWSRFWWSKSIQNIPKVTKSRRNHEISIWPNESEYFFTGISKIAVPTWKTSTKRRKIDDFKMSSFFRGGCRAGRLWYDMIWYGRMWRDMVQKPKNMFFKIVRWTLGHDWRSSLILLGISKFKKWKHFLPKDV